MQIEVPIYLLELKQMAWDLQKKIRTIPEAVKELLKTQGFWKVNRKKLYCRCFDVIMAVNRLEKGVLPDGPFNNSDCSE